MRRNATKCIENFKPSFIESVLYFSLVRKQKLIISKRFDNAYGLATRPGYNVALWKPNL